MILHVEKLDLHRMTSLLILGFIVTNLANIAGEMHYITANEGSKIVLKCHKITKSEIIIWYIQKPHDATIVVRYDSDSGLPIIHSDWSGDLTVSKESDITITLKYPRDNDHFICKEVYTITRVAEYDVTVKVPPSGLSFNYKRISENGIILRDDEEATISITMSRGSATVNTTTWTVGNEIVGSTATVRLKAKREWNGQVLKCEVTNAAASASITRTITVYYGPDITLNPDMTTYVVRENGTLGITAVVDARPSQVAISWKNSYRVIRVGRGLLQFTSIKRSDAGTYTVYAKNTEKSTHMTITIRVEYSPSVVMQKISEGQLKCITTKGMPTAFTYYVEQSVGDTKVRDVPDGHITRHINQIIITYNHRSYEDAGTYTCKVWNTIGGSSASLAIATDSAPIITDPHSSFNIGVDETKSIKVPFYSLPKYANFAWRLDHYPNFKIFDKDTKYNYVTKSNVALVFHGVKAITSGYMAVFYVRDATYGSSGNYTLTITNKIGSVSTTVAVRVIETLSVTTPAKEAEPVSDSEKCNNVIYVALGASVGSVIVTVIVFVVLIRRGCLSNICRERVVEKTASDVANDHTVTSQGASVYQNMPDSEYSRLDALTVLPSSEYHKMHMYTEMGDVTGVNKPRSDVSHVY